MTSALVGNIQRYSTEDGPGIRTTVFLKGCPLSCVWCHNPELISPKQGIIFSPSKCISCGYCAEACPCEAIELKGTHRKDGGMSLDEEIRGHSLEPGEQRGHSPQGCVPIINRSSGMSSDEEPGESGGHSPQGCVPTINRNKCDVCLKCTEICYSGALAPVATLMNSDEVFEIVKRDKSFYDNTGGGLTLSGGEVLIHAAFAEELINLCASEGVSSCIDTSGYGSFEVLDSLASLPSVTDILYDIKALDDNIHQKYTGVSNKRILENFALLSKKHGARVKIHARLPLIKGVNDDIEMLTQTAKFLAEIMGTHRKDGGMSPDATLIQEIRGHSPQGCVPIINRSSEMSPDDEIRGHSPQGCVPFVIDATLIPYHNLGVSKARNIGETATVFDAPDDDVLQRIKESFITHGIPTAILAEE